MLEHFLQLFGIFSASFITPFVIAAQPVELALPQDVQYAPYIAAQLHEAAFSSDPTSAVNGQVAAGRAELQAFIANSKVCVASEDTSSYRLVVRNVGDTTAHDVVVQFQYPAGTSLLDTQPDPERELSQDRLLEWFVDSLAPGQLIEFQVVLAVDLDIHSLVTQLTVFHDEGGRVLTEHTINGACGTYTGPTSALPPGKLPAIICDPAEIGCQPTAHLLNLGPNFGSAQAPIVCSPNDPTGCAAHQPALGVRFAEAIADIIPGDCRVLEDNIVATPEFHDALNRRARPADAFMFPLYQSGRDFRKLVHENVLLGIPHQIKAQDTLRAIYVKHRDKQIEPIQAVLDHKLASGVVRSSIQPWYQAWREDTSQAQINLKQGYDAIQTQRQPKIDPLLPLAVANAQDSVEQSCGAKGDGGLSALLPAVKQAYLRNLNERTGAYNQTQQTFLNSPRLSRWQGVLIAALDAFDQGRPDLLRQYLHNIPADEREAFNEAFQAYSNHSQTDENADHRVRLNEWEVALDRPKTVATNCEKELRLGAYVETTWCESGIQPEVIIQGAPNPARKDITPPQPIEGGDQASINERLISGQSAPPACRGLPGDPWWAADCSCNCGSLIPNLRDPNNPNIGFCQFGQQAKRIVRHDINISTQLECLADDGRRHNHQDPFF